MDQKNQDKWKSVTPEEARLSPYYGISGWLLLLYVINVWSMIFAVVFVPEIGLIDIAFFEALDEEPVPLAAALINLALYLPILVLVPLKHPLAPRMWIIGLWLAFFINIIFFPGLYGSGPKFLSVIGVILLTWYLKTSQRVSVTFYHRIPTDQDIADFPPVKPNRLRNRRLLYGTLGTVTIAPVIAIVILYQPMDVVEGDIDQSQKSFYEAEKVLRPLAESGSIESQYGLGYLYDNASGALQNLNLAAKWYLKAARGGHQDAQNSIGLMYVYGRGVEQNVGEAVGWFRKAANQGNPRAQANIGDMYFEGVGVARNIEEALYWYRRASNQGDVHGQLSLGWMYYAGLGVPEKDFIEAYKLTRLAANKGAENAEQNLALIALQMSPQEILRADHLARTWTPSKEN